MTFKELSEEDKKLILSLYNSDGNRDEIQEELSNKFDVAKRTIRAWAKELEVGILSKNILTPNKIMIYDIETGRVPALVWWTGKQYINHNQLTDEPSIITIAWQWLGEDEVHHLTWDENHSDEAMVKEFLKEYNKADMVIGQNNDRFDNRWINARAMKYGFYVNTFVRSFDIMKQTKRLFRLPSYSMAYISKFLGVTQKVSHEGITMWDKIQYGTKEEQKEYLAKMVDYNIGDIVATSDMYLALRKYMGHQVHFGVMGGEEKYSCPNCGGTHIELERTTVTPAGTVQRIMKCLDDEVRYKLPNTQYVKFLDFKMREEDENRVEPLV